MTTKRYAKMMQVYSGLKVKANKEINVEEIISNIISLISTYLQTKDLKTAKALIDNAEQLNYIIHDIIATDYPVIPAEQAESFDPDINKKMDILRGTLPSSPLENPVSTKNLADLSGRESNTKPSPSIKPIKRVPKGKNE